MKKHIPNCITCLNVLCGCLALMFSLQGNYQSVAILISLAAIFDFMDGMVARLLHAPSELGKQLDSLADMVSFGVVPGAVVYSMLSSILHHTPLLPSSLQELLNTDRLLPLIGMLIPIFSSLRLAKFNIDTRQNENFIGLPTPANTLFFIILALFYTTGSNTSMLYQFLFDSWIPLAVLTLAFSYLLVAEIPMFSLKVKHLSWKGNEKRILFVLTIIALFGFLGLAGLIFLIPIYIVFSLVK